MVRLPQMPESVTHVLGKSVTYVPGSTTTIEPGVCGHPCGHFQSGLVCTTHGARPCSTSLFDGSPSSADPRARPRAGAGRHDSSSSADDHWRPDI